MVLEAFIEVLHALIELLDMLQLQVLQLCGVLEGPDKRLHVRGRNREVDQAQTAKADLRVLLIETVNQVLEVMLGLNFLQDELVAGLFHNFKELDNEIESEKVLILKLKDAGVVLLKWLLFLLVRFYLRQSRDNELLDQEVHLTLSINLVNGVVVHHTIVFEEHVMERDIGGADCKEI